MNAFSMNVNLMTTRFIHSMLVCFTLLSCTSFAKSDTNVKKELTDIGLSGFSETVFIVSDIKHSIAFFTSTGGWQIVEPLAQIKPNNSGLHTLWKLPTTAKIKHALVGNKGVTTGYVRLVEISGVNQELIRSNTQSWDVGGIFDVNMRVANMETKFKEMRSLGWQGASDPVQFSFGPFEVKEWITKDADGIAFALIERMKPTLEGWPHLKELSRVFNSTQVVADIQKSLPFYQEILGFKTYLKHKGASSKASANVLGLPYNMTTQVERSVYILHPQGINEGSVELLQFHGASGKNVANLAHPPNKGIVTLRFPVKNIEKLSKRLQRNNIFIESRVEMELRPYGLVDILAIKSPDNTWLEFYQIL